MPRARELAMVLTIATLTLPLSGCWIYSVYGLAEDDEAKLYDARLVGNWEAGGECRLAIEYAPERSEYRITASATGENCPSPKGLIRYSVALIEIEGVRYLDVQSQGIEGLAIPAHSFFVVDVGDDGFSIAALSAGLFETAVGDRTLAGWTERYAVVTTANSKQLRNFISEIQRHGDFVEKTDEGEFRFTFKKLAAGVPAVHPENEFKENKCQ